MKIIKTIFVIMFILLISSRLVEAQIFEWAKSAGVSSDNRCISITTDAAGNVYEVGNFRSATISFGATMLTNKGASDVLIVKYDPSGNVLWAKSFGGSDQDWGCSITTDAAGNVYASGAFHSATIAFGTTTLTNGGSYGDMFVVKLDPSGNVLWAKSAPGDFDDAGQAISADTYGNVYVAGWFTSYHISFGSTTLTHTGGYFDSFIVKYDSNGNVLWVKGTGGSNDEQTQSITTDAAGNAYMAGWYNPDISFGSTTLPNYSGGYNSFIVKYDSSGNVLWAKGAGAFGYYSITADIAGNVYVTGLFTSSATFGATTLTCNGGSDVLVVKYNPSGDVLWAKSAGGSVSDYATTITADIAGNAYAGGYFSSSTITFGTTTLTNNGGQDAFIVKYNPSGNVLWAKSAGGSGDEGVGGITADAAGNVYTTGLFSSPTIVFGSTTLTINSGSSGYSDVFIAKLSDAPLPVELTSFTGKSQNNKVILKWKTATEVNNSGFDIEKKDFNAQGYEKIGFVHGAGNSNSPKSYSFTDKSFSGKASYRLKQVDNTGDFKYSGAVEIVSIPSSYVLSQNYPNPFNPSTAIVFALPEKTGVVISVYDQLGKKVAVLLNAEKEAGYHNIEWNASNMASGVYFYELKTPKFRSVKKLLLMK